MSENAVPDGALVANGVGPKTVGTDLDLQARRRQPVLVHEPQPYRPLSRAQFDSPISARRDQSASWSGIAGNDPALAPAVGGLGKRDQVRRLDRPAPRRRALDAGNGEHGTGRHQPGQFGRGSPAASQVRGRPLGRLVEIRRSCRPARSPAR